MSRTGSCPVCNREMKLPDDAEGRLVKCRGCESVLAIRGEVGPRYELEAVEAGDVDAPSACSVCGAHTRAADTFCGACGADLGAAAAATAEATAEGAAASERAASRGRTAAKRGRHGRASRQKSSRSAARWLLALGILFVLGGLYMSHKVQVEAEKARVNLAQFDDDEPLELEDGSTSTAAELRQQIDFEVVFVPALNFGLAALMIGLFFWARRAPFPAILTGLCTYVAVIVLNAFLDPITLTQGIIIKVIAIAGLLDGLKAALAERVIGQHEQGVR